MPSRRLFEPVQLGPLTLRNRIVFPPMTTGYEEKGVVTPRSRQFYRAIAEGGAGLIILGDVSIQPSFAPTPYLFDDRFIPGLRELVDDVHAAGARIGAQLFHQEYDTAVIGRLMHTEGREAAVARLHADMADYCNHLSLDEIVAILDRFRRAAIRVRDAGFDLIQVHGDRLIGMFTSHLLNRRTDHYGGSLRNRSRFALEVVETIRAAVPDMPVEYKLAVIRTDPPMGKGGPTISEAQELAGWLEDAGVIGFHVALANHGAIGDTIPAMGTQPFGCFLDLAAAITRVARVPVTAVGRIVEPAFAEQIVASGQAGLVAIGRGMIAEPAWVRLAEQARQDEMRPCVMCNHCTGSLMSSQPLRCAVNATIGEADPIDVRPAASPRRVLVIGGGPAGMEAAHVAARRGHDVTLVEQQTRLGGQLPLCSAPPFKHELSRLTTCLMAHVARQGVRVRLGSEASIDTLLDELRPDAVIVATGALPAVPPIPGLHASHVVTAWQALAETAAVGARAVVIGGGAVGVETALFLAPRGVHVTIVEMLDQIASDESATIVPFLHAQLANHHVDVLTGHRVVEVTARGVVVAAAGAAAQGDSRELACDTVVVAAGTRRQETFESDIRSRGIECHVIGDCAEQSAGTIAGAIRDGFWAGMHV
jgi:2,4-dienoyl-CoA reductase-like NADH-dependent reductase (Old Yellow Enzyme family)/thioredoxin reductase